MQSLICVSTHVETREAIVDFYNLSLCSSSLFENWNSSDGSGNSRPKVNGMTLRIFPSFNISIPPLPEQVAIARYLDYVDSRVRRLTEAKRKLIGLLTEQKQAIIHRAVTRGLDPNVPLKDSGIEWLGMVPQHWEVRRL